MLGRHEIPTKLEVEDKIVFGMTARQLLFLGMGIALGYVLFQRLNHFGATPPGHLSFLIVLRIIVGVIPVGITLIVAFIRPADRPLETWGMALLHYTTMPKRCVWRPLQGHGDHNTQALLAELTHSQEQSDEPDTSDEPIRLGNRLAYQEVMHGQ